ncbi:membrane or secreted protein [Mucilaginibacter psychrotolerans]|uniref:Membrane or secreted protein n=1 Tax=Mucilaginibacter psychrotolerans TaxID=1524096 RepID=A0A4Y8SBN4_9SPHI|nr:membrane or secreted protein [Mucilaginibacter psychrotolerans]TFF36378.1 membrane or secreted protein [Mucilaginibacter psychrotolerans]
MKFKAIIILTCFYLFGVANTGRAQTGVPKSKANEIYIDAKGIIRLQKDDSEASFFGVNYTVPFAYGYRSHKKLSVDLEKAIDADVYHLARLGVTAFRVHVWDTEISDFQGNLKENEHLRLFDYLLFKLEERGIRTIITPIAFWGNGYPDKDEHTGSFSDVYGKEKALVDPKAFEAQERYLTQFFKHVNPYTKKTYGQDRFIIATEINNEPHHSGPKALTTNYINRIMAAIKSTGWTKPVFYNISESPWYADAVAASTANGFSFQWYPTGLVSGREQLGNLLPQVDHYNIPFDTIPAFKNKPRMVYEFESGDVLQPYMYPAMARSFKTAGFQWATQFAYDPMATAYANTEYQTHYLNLAYTPSKAISLLIAGKVFKQVPVYKSFGSYPADTTFGAFRVSYKQQLSEMNAPAEFYYSNSTSSVPVQAKSLQHIAGVGSSPLVKYAGSGAYFLDKVAAGVWRLEVMPDAVKISDPFERTSLDKPVTAIVYSAREMRISLADLGGDFSIKQVNQKRASLVAKGNRIIVRPGVYLLSKKGGIIPAITANTKVGYMLMNEFYAPAPNGRKATAVVMTSTLVTPSTQSGSLLIYQPASNRQTATIYSPEWKSDNYDYITGQQGQLLLNLQHLFGTKAGGMEAYIKPVLLANKAQLSGFKSIVINASADTAMAIKIILIDEDANAYSASVNLNKQFKEIRIPITSLKKDEMILLPRPYPGFQAFSFKSPGNAAFIINKVEKLQVLIPGQIQHKFSVQLGEVRLETTD